MSTVTIILCVLVVAGAVAFPYNNWSLLGIACAVVAGLVIVLLFEMS